MDVIPTTSTTKRVRAKASASTPTIAKPVRKTLTASKKGARVASATQSAAQSPAELRTAIQCEAYYLAAARGFAPGHELDDWLEAEKRIEAQR